MKSQEQLKKIYLDEYKKIYGDDAKWLTYETKSIGYLVEWDEKIFKIEKPSIQTKFCFGYGMYGQSTESDEDEAYNMASIARKQESYFIKSNLENINNEIKILKEILNNMENIDRFANYPPIMLEVNSNYNSNILYYYNVIKTFDRKKDDSSIVTDKKLLINLIKGYEEVKKAFTKRLLTYLKKYGLSKIDVWTYLRD